MAGDLAQAATARVLASLNAGSEGSLLSDLGGSMETDDPIARLSAGDDDKNATGAPGRRKGGTAVAPAAPAAPAAASSSKSPAKTSSSRGGRGRGRGRGRGGGRGSSSGSSRDRVGPAAGVDGSGAAGAAAPAATAAAAAAAATAAAAVDDDDDDIPQQGLPQMGLTVQVQGAQAEAARKALELNLKLQAALREELSGVDQTLQRNREVLKAAEARLVTKRCAGITTSSEKFVWAKAVLKFLSTMAHPEDAGPFKEQEMLLRRESIAWKTQDTKLLRRHIAEKYPEAADPRRAHEALENIDWEEVANSVEVAARGGVKRQKTRRFRTPEDCRLRWINADMPGFADETSVSWSKEEDLAIVMHAEEQGEREWVKIADEVHKATGGVRRRSPAACLRRFQFTLNTGFVNRFRWSPEEDLMLQAAIKRHGTRSWLNVARDFPGRSPSQCYNRYRNTRAGAGLTRALPETPAGQRQVPAHIERHRKNIEALEDSDDDVDGGTGGLGGDGGEEFGAAVDDDAGTASGDGRRSPPTLSGRKRKKRFIGTWAPNEERRLCLCVRALMPQQRPQAPTGGGVGGGVDGGGVTATNGRRSGDDGKGKGGYTNTMDLFYDVDWVEVSKLMSNTRTGWQCQEKWFEVLDPSVNRNRDWEEEEDEELLKLMEGRKPGGWKAIERHMAHWAQERGMLRRTDQGCLRRFMKLEPEKYEEHLREARDRREVEPRRNAPSHANSRIHKTEITFEDFDLVEDGEEPSGDDRDDDRDDDDDNDDNDDYDDDDDDDDEEW